MAILSTMELPGSPLEQASFGGQTYYWNPAAELLPGETVASPTARVLAYDPTYTVDTVDVTAAVLAAGSPFLGTGAFASMVGVTIPANVLTPGLEYRVQVSCVASAAHTPARYFRIRCVV